MQEFTSNIMWTCPECGETKPEEVAVPELNFDAEKMSDMTANDHVEISCNSCGIKYTGQV